MSSDDLPEADRVEGAPHPRETERLFGQEAAEAGFLEAFNSGRLHHAWLLTGPLGVGKATLAWRIARFLLATPMDQGGGLFGEAPPVYDTLDISPDHPVSHRLLARSEPGMFSITRSVNEKTGRLRDMITVDDVRGLTHFLTMSSTEGGRRVVIVDAADEMNVNAANALLKMLEEPPSLTTILLISHQPSRLLPTIRSRCRELRLSALKADTMHMALVQADASEGESPALAALSAGSVGEAVRLTRLGGLPMYQEIVSIFATLPGLDRPRAMKLAEAAAARGAADKFELLLTLIDVFLARLARTGATSSAPVPEAAKGEAEVLLRLSPNPTKARHWADIAQQISERTRHGQAVNLDPAALVLDTVFKITETASR
ncbi:DNA polymerase III subunit delta' [Shimia thalassica]|uniref:DNA polymerase III subunit delta' n=1 Tax=Shimia thalassica TaxID=1715693 RepID=UPI001C08ADA4|nr:DNA polymerase III subunit delta' [Shimia thalassica]MBU2941883.1 DNA polymerase III subunit delta' [Shimia thalassica]MDO6505222.1 DNA polymerase III subunit delta' [Shimia thalassica]